MNYRDVEEEVLMERTACDDRHAFDEIVHRYQHPLQIYAARMLGSDQATAADLAVEALVRLWERRTEYRNCDRLASWLYRTTHRLVLDEMIKVKARGSLMRLESECDDVQRRVEIQAQADAAKAAVLGLSVPLRSVFILSVFQEMSYRDIADALEISPGTVASRKHEAVEVLRRKLSAWKETQ